MRIRIIEKTLDESKADQIKLSNYVGQETADRFIKIKNSLKSPYNDIYYWLKQDKDALANYLDNTKGQKKRSAYKQELERICSLPEANDVDFICEQDGYKIYRINTPEASVKWGLVVGGKAVWCISGGYVMNNYDPEKNPNMILEKATEYFNQYLRDYYKDYYFVIGHNTKYAICVTQGHYGKSCYHICDIWDQSDHVIEYIPYLNDIEISEDEFIYIKPTYKMVNNSTIQIYPTKKITSLSFEGNTSIIQTILFPEGLEEIGAEAFEDYSELRKVVFPQSLKKIGDESFLLCFRLKDVTIPPSVEYIGEEAFFPKTFLHISDKHQYDMCKKLGYKCIYEPEGDEMEKDLAALCNTSEANRVVEQDTSLGTCYKIMTPEALIKYGLVIGHCESWHQIWGEYSNVNDIIENTKKFFTKNGFGDFHAINILYYHGTYLLCENKQGERYIINTEGKKVTFIPDYPEDITDSETGELIYHIEDDDQDDWY